ncbi:MAG: SRPBCC family protein [Saprospiraceae bacterium]|nr:SRPBCC family protein [Saprospiraceae bacterium]
MNNLCFTILMFTTMAAQAQESNYHFSHTETTTAPAARIWQVWTDVPNWKQWDKGLKEAILEGEFAIGAKGKIIPDKGPKSKFVVTELKPGESYTFKTRIPFGWLIIRRYLTHTAGITRFTHEVEFTGVLKKALGKNPGKRYRAMLPEVMRTIAALAEK